MPQNFVLIFLPKNLKKMLTNILTHFLTILALLLPTFQKQDVPTIIFAKEDQQIFEKIMLFSKKENLHQKDLAQIELKVAEQFMKVQYMPHTLEIENEEKLIINLRQLDCTTFLENVVALSKCIQENKTTFADYAQILQQIRYRNGKIDRYPSRLHYFTDWILDNQQKGLLDIVSNEIGSADFDTKVNFMSTHPESYKQLASTQFLDEIKKQEAKISLAKLKYIPKDELRSLENKIQDGDLLALATNIKGLDISHVAIAKHHNGRLHFLHASMTNKEVELSKMPLADYLIKSKKSTGLLVCRLKK